MALLIATRSHCTHKLLMQQIVKEGKKGRNVPVKGNFNSKQPLGLQCVFNVEQFSITFDV